MAIANELYKQIGIILSIILILVGAYILNTSLDYYSGSFSETQTFVSDCVDLVETAGDHKIDYTTEVLILGTNEAYNITVKNETGNLIGVIFNNINNVMMKNSPLYDEEHKRMYDEFIYYINPFHWFE